MIEGDAIEPIEFTIDYEQSYDGMIDCDFDYHDFEFNGSSITSTASNIFDNRR